MGAVGTSDAALRMFYLHFTLELFFDEGVFMFLCQSGQLLFYFYIESNLKQLRKQLKVIENAIWKIKLLINRMHEHLLKNQVIT